ncbi:hypothetical protein [Bacillus sp. JJ722]|uniref:hypothetical protein n=1 Tax=Bacillus sp. JJ722 TaxID=3122973 RepID=UPI0030002852
MIGYFMDFLIVAILVVGFTALNGVIGNTIGEKLFRGKKKDVHVDASLRTQTGWNQVGGK